MASICVDYYTAGHSNPFYIITTTNCASGVCHRLLYEEPPQLKYWTFCAKSASIARNQPLRSQYQRNHRRHRPSTFISTIPVYGPTAWVWPPSTSMASICLHTTYCRKTHLSGLNFAVLSEPSLWLRPGSRVRIAVQQPSESRTRTCVLLRPMILKRHEANN